MERKPEGEAENVEVLAAVAEGGEHVHEHLTVLHVLRVDQHDAVCRTTTTPTPNDERAFELSVSDRIVFTRILYCTVLQYIRFPLHITL